MSGSIAKPLVVSLGDPAGIGPELIVDAWARREAERLPPFFVAGGASVLVEAAKTRGIELAVTSVEDPTEAVAAFNQALPILGKVDGDYQPGQPDDDGAGLALGSLEAAAAYVVEGRAAAVVTAPISKDQLARVGFTFPGQTEFVAAVCGASSDDAVMLLAGPRLRTVPMTVHCALSEVSGRLSTELIVRRSRIVARALRQDFGIVSPHLAICGLNPHAGENGRMGREEIEIIAPAIAALREEGIEVSGPHPADALFAPHAREGYDVAIAMYHDQALIPLKTLDFDQGVNVTLGLPIVRTSPDHGTAFGIAGTGQASASAMIAAIRMAGQMALRREGASTGSTPAE